MTDTTQAHPSLDIYIGPGLQQHIHDIDMALRGDFGPDDAPTIRIRAL
jgi:hypothetical protein